MFDERVFIKYLLFFVKKKIASGEKIDKDRVFDEIEKMSRSESMLHTLYKLTKNKKKGNKNTVNSYLAYLLGVTSKEPDGPFEPKLSFELARISHPDIDIDFDFFYRQSVYDYLISRYGREYTANIGTYQRLKAKNALRTAIKALDPFNDKEKSLEFENYVAKLVPDDPTIKLEKAIEENSELERISKKSNFKDVFFTASVLEGNCSYASRHAAGIVISDAPIGDIAPLHRTAKGEYATQFEMAELEDVGLIKFDILALKTLSVFSMIEKDIKDYLDIDLDIDKIPHDDRKALRLISQGKTDSVFQLESGGMKDLLREMQVDTFHDVAASNALHRPGAMSASADSLYCECKHGNRKITYDHPDISGILKETYGQIIYQEQCQLISMKLANFSRREADKLRKAIGKKEGDLFIKIRTDFIKRAKEHSNMQEDKASVLFQKIENMGGYAFCKCLDGSTLVVDKITGKTFSLEELSGYDVEKSDFKLIFDSYLDGEVVEDEVVEIFKVGQMEVFEVELNDGSVIKCTLDHKFYCSDGDPHTVREIIEKDLEILTKDMIKLKISSIKSLGVRDVYNVEMKSDQHNYFIKSDAAGADVLTTNSHAYAYSVLSVQCAYLKAHYPLYYMKSVLNSEIMDPSLKFDNVERYMRECLKMDIKILPCDVNKSKDLFTIEKDRLRRPLSSLKGVGRKAALEIAKLAPFKDFEDFVEKTDGISVVNKSAVEALMENGAFSNFKLYGEKGLEEYMKLRNHVQYRKKKKIQKSSMFDLSGVSFM